MKNCEKLLLLLIVCFSIICFSCTDTLPGNGDDSSLENQKIITVRNAGDLSGSKLFVRNHKDTNSIKSYNVAVGEPYVYVPEEPGEGDDLSGNTVQGELTVKSENNTQSEDVVYYLMSPKSGTSAASSTPWTGKGDFFIIVLKENGEIWQYCQMVPVEAETEGDPDFEFKAIRISISNKNTVMNFANFQIPPNRLDNGH